MIRDILKRSEYIILKWYATLHLQQQRIIKLYREGGITKDIADKELRSIYNWMKISRKIDNFLMFLMAKAQSFSLER